MFCEITTHDDGVHQRAAVRLDRQRTEHEKYCLGQTIERHQPEQCVERLFDDERGREHQPVRQPLGRVIHAVVPHVTVAGRLGGRPRIVFDHQCGGRVRGIGESDQVAEQHRPATGRQVHGQCAHYTEEQLEPIEAGPLFGPAEQRVPGFGRVT